MNEEAISLEETNKIRISLGLKPIPVSQSESHLRNENRKEFSAGDLNKVRASLGFKQSAVHENSTNKELTSEEYQEQKLRLTRDAEVRSNLDLARLKVAKKRKIEISKNILDNYEESSTDDWLNNLKAPVSNKKVNVQKKRRLEESHDFENIKVAHKIEDLDSVDHDLILTLKDQSVLDEDYELESSEINAKKKLEKEIAAKLRTDKFKNHDGVLGEGDQKTVLEKYEEEINGDSNEFFMLNKLQRNTSQIDDNSQPEKRNKVAFNLDKDSDDGSAGEEVSDYVKMKPIKMKKLKKKVGGLRKKELETDFDGDIVLQDVKLKDEDEFIQDDSELQLMLSKKRREVQRKSKRRTPEEIANEIENEMDDEPEQFTGIVIDENTEFLSSIKTDVKENSQIDEVDSKPTEFSEPILENNDQNAMDTIDIKTEEEESESVNFNGGLASTLSFLKSKKLISEVNEQDVELEKKSRLLKQELEKKKLRLGIERRRLEEQLRNDATFRKLSKKEREEYINKQLDSITPIHDSKEIAARLKDYNPEVKLKYIDEYGREMNTKEAFKHLSHQFHGKGPGQNKVEKKLKRINEENKIKEKQNTVW